MLCCTNYLDSRPQTVSSYRSSPGSQPAPGSGCLHSILCGSQDSWALNKHVGRRLCASANHPVGQNTSSGLPQHLARFGKIHPFHFRIQDIFIAVPGRMAILEKKKKKYAASHLSKSHFTVTPYNPGNVWAGQSAVTLCWEVLYSKFWKLGEAA